MEEKTSKKTIGKPEEKKVKKEKKTKKKKKLKVSFISNIGLSEEKEYFMENLSMLLVSGMDILSAIEAIKTGIRSKMFRKLINQVSEEIDSGSSLSKALKNANLFPDHVVSLIRIGEETGRLADNLKVVVVQQQKERSFRSKVRSAMMYPVLVLGLTGVVGIGIAWFILPRLSSVFSSLRLELPLVTRVLIQIGDFVGEYGTIVVPIAIAILFFIIWFIFLFSKTKFIGQFLLFKVPGVGTLIQQVQIAQMGYILGTLLGAGLPIVGAVGSLAEATTFLRYKKFFLFLQKSVEDGNSIFTTFKIYPRSDKLVTIPIQQMIASSEKSGRLPDTLLKVGEIFEEKTETTTKNLAVILEPVMLIIIWLGVIGVALAVILPIYSLVGGLNQSSTPTPPPPVPSIELKINTEDIATIPDIVTEEIGAVVLDKLIVLPNSVGYLNVRSGPSANGELLLQIYPDEIYKYKSEDVGWYEIVLPDDTTGWVSGGYVELINEND